MCQSDTSPPKIVCQPQKSCVRNGHLRGKKTLCRRPLLEALPGASIRGPSTHWPTDKTTRPCNHFVFDKIYFFHRRGHFRRICYDLPRGQQKLNPPLAHFEQNIFATLLPCYVCHVFCPHVTSCSGVKLLQTTTWKFSYNHISQIATCDSGWLVRLGH